MLDFFLSEKMLASNYLLSVLLIYKRTHLLLYGFINLSLVRKMGKNISKFQITEMITANQMSR
jgi:hypothetical protein